MDLFRILLIGVVTLFYLFYFVKQVLLKKKGIVTNRLSRGDKPLRTYRIERLLSLLTIAMFILQYVSILYGADLLGSWQSSVSVSVGGIVVAVMGLVFFLSALATMKDSWRAGIDSTQKTAIVTGGVYRYSRNPAFVGFDLLYIGTCMVYPNIFLIVFTLLTLYCFHLQILEEEQYLPSVFGKDYELYKKKVRRYF